MFYEYIQVFNARLSSHLAEANNGGTRGQPGHGK
jgi:hypothetical protein